MTLNRLNSNFNKCFTILFFTILINSTLHAIGSDTTRHRKKTADTTAVAKSYTKMPKGYYIPKFSATVLGRYEFNTNTNQHHFELRHTRIGVSGNVHPMFSYMALVDLTYGGNFSPVAIFANFKPVKGLSILIGYDKMPFSNENLLSPYMYYFSDKSFLTQKISGWSDVGCIVSYRWDKVLPFEIKAGVFNSDGFSNQGKFQKSLNYVVRGTFYLFDGFDLTFNYAAVKPEAVRTHNLDFGLRYQYKGFHIESEYIYRWYKPDATITGTDGTEVVFPDLKNTNALECFAYYAFAINKPWLDNVALSLRYDAISPTTKENMIDNKYIVDPTRQRITAGISMIFVEKPLRAGIRLNYEKNFMHSEVPCDQDRIILEFTLHY